MMTVFIQPAELNEEIKIIGDDARHLFVLRPNIGDILFLSDGENFLYNGKITSIDKQGLLVKIMEKTPIKAENEPQITLFAGLLKGDKNEFVIQKATELGVQEIVFFTSKNCIIKIDGKEDAKKVRFEKTAKLASMQCGRQDITKIGDILSFDEMLKKLEEKKGFFFYEMAVSPFSGFLKSTDLPKTTAFVVGPEGGFTSEEVFRVKEKNIPILSLGKRILRAETVPICVLSVLMAHFGEF